MSDKNINEYGLLIDQGNRLTAVEQDVSQLKAGIAALSIDLKTNSEQTRETLKEITSKLDTSGKITSSTIIGVLALLATYSAVLAGGVWWAADQSVQPVIQGLEHLDEWRKDHTNNHGHPAIVADMAATQSNLISMRDGLDAASNRMERLELWYNGHGQNMVSDVVELRGMINSLSKDVDANTRDLASEDSDRFSSSDWDRLSLGLSDKIRLEFRPRLSTIDTKLDDLYTRMYHTDRLSDTESTVRSMGSNRFTGQEGGELKTKVDSNTEKIDGIKEEQQRRTSKVYDKE